MKFNILAIVQISKLNSGQVEPNPTTNGGLWTPRFEVVALLFIGEAASHRWWLGA